MRHTPYQRFYSASPRAFGPSAKEVRERERLRLAAEVDAYLAKGGSITLLPYGASAIPDTYGSSIFEDHISPPPLSGSAPHDPSKVAVRAKRRRYGRLPNA